MDNFENTRQFLRQNIEDELKKMKTKMFFRSSLVLFLFFSLLLGIGFLDTIPKKILLTNDYAVGGICVVMTLCLFFILCMPLAGHTERQIKQMTSFLGVVSSVPQTAEDYFALGSVFKKHGHAEEAQWCFDKAAEIKSSFR